MTSLERALIVAIKWTLAGLILSVPLLLVDVGPDPKRLFLIHLSVLVGFGIALTAVLLPYTGDDWFQDPDWSRALRLTGSGVGVVALVTGAVALVSLASSAAMQYDPSTQFLQLLSALDIAWAGAAIMIGAYRLWNRSVAVAGGVVLGVFCVWSIWFYLDAVGFGPEGEWIVSGTDMMTRVIPFDVMAATIAVILFTLGVRKQTANQR